MNEYINKYHAVTMLQAIKNELKKQEKWFITEEGIDAMIDKLCETSSVDSIEVVKCRDCKNWNEDCIQPYCGWCNEFDRAMYCENFCSYGER